jgi:hypothetical protein
MIAVGAYALLFNRSFSQTMIRQQKAIWKVDLSAYETALRVISAAVGIGLLVVGILGGAELLLG